MLWEFLIKMLKFVI